MPLNQWLLSVILRYIHSYVHDLRMTMCPKTFRPNWSFVKAIHSYEGIALYFHKKICQRRIFLVFSFIFYLGAFPLPTFCALVIDLFRCLLHSACRQAPREIQFFLSQYWLQVYIGRRKSGVYLHKCFSILRIHRN